MSEKDLDSRVEALERAVHTCAQGPRLLRLESDAARAEADRRQLREDVTRTMTAIATELVGMTDTTKSHLDELRDDLDRRTRAAFARIDELRALLGAEGHA